MHARTAKGPLNRSPATIAIRVGARLVAALLPLAVLEIAHLAPTSMSPEQGASLRVALAAAAAAATGAGFLAAAVVGLRERRLLTLADAGALGILAATFSLAAMRATGTSGIAIGLAMSALVLAARPATASAAFEVRPAPAAGMAGLFVAVEGTVILILVGAPAVAVTGLTAMLLAGAAALLTLAAVAAMKAADPEPYALGLVAAASGAATLALAGPNPGETVVGVAALSIAAVMLGWTRALASARRSARPAEGAPEPASATGPEPEFSEAERLVRELRGTIEELVAARRTVDLQRGEIERATRLDATTGVIGRAAILERLRIEAAEARRYAHPLAVVLLDVDDFDDLNQRFGLEAGDAILREVALRLRLRVREADALGRIGDDAFLAILPHTDEAGAARFAEAFRDRLIERPIGIGGEPVEIAVSIGIALVRPGMDLGHDQLLNAATEALASAKAAGGNRIAFDRLHGLARLDERRLDRPGAADEPDVRNTGS